jgi:iodotyrosine deiodinase
VSSHRPYTEHVRFSPEEAEARIEDFREHMLRRRTVREFSPEPVARGIIDAALQVALSAPSGANLQPWSFVVVESSAVRSELRVAAEAEEREFYEHRAPQEWLDALLPFGTDASKPFLETAPVLIAIFARSWMPLPDGRKGKHYYVSESVGIAAGFLIAALHQAGLATLTHTPSPMQFLNRILGRPDHERPYLLLVAGYPAAGCQVPDITRRPFAESVFRV